jgi:serine/threonine protein kinase
MVSELQGVADWQLQGVIAEGENATVYRAKRAMAGGSEPERALKLSHASESDETLGGAVRAFQERSGRARSLGHAGIVATIDVGEVEGRPYLVSEWIEGVSLDVFPVKRAGRLKPELAMVVMVDLLEALAGAAQQGLVHGRLDAGDVLIDEEGRVMIAGFGEEDSEQADFLAVVSLAREICGGWPSSVEDWIEGLEDGVTTFDSLSAALDAFPLGAFSRDALEQGRKSLVRAVKRALVKSAKENAVEPGAEPEPSVETTPAEASPGTLMEPRLHRFSDFTQRIMDDRAAQDDEVLDSAIVQATRVAWLCGALVVTGVIIEVVRFTG